MAAAGGTAFLSSSGVASMSGVPSASLMGWSANSRMLLTIGPVNASRLKHSMDQVHDRSALGSPVVARRGRFGLVCLGSGLANIHESTPPAGRLRRRHPRHRDRMVASIAASAARTPSLSVDPTGGSADAGAKPGRAVAAAAAAGVPGPSMSAATVAVARGDVATGLEIFLRCMSARRLRSSRAEAAQEQNGVPACNKFLRALGDAGRIDEAVSSYEAMTRSGLRPTIVTFSTLISRAGACRRVRLAERFYREMLEAGIPPDVQAMNSLINAFSKAGSPDEALKVFSQMSHYGVTPSLITFNTLIDACARAGDIERARQVFDGLGEAGLRPNDRTFSSLIHSHAVRGQVDEAFSLLKDMRARGLVPNRVTYSALINACGRAGQLARAFQTLDEMCSAGIEPNVVTWTTLIDACGKGHELEWSFRLFSEMRESGIVPNGVTCSALMDACLKADELDLAFAVLEHMLDVGIEPTEVTYTSLLTQCARLGKADKAGMVLDGLNRKRASAGRDANADSVGMNPGNENTTAAFPSHQGNETAAVQKGTGLEGKAPAVENENGEAGGTGGAGQASWKIDPKLENDLVKLFGQANQVDGAFKVLEGMVARRESPDSETWLVLLNVVDTASALDKAVALMERSRAEGRGSEINELTYSALLGACGRAKKLARAFRVVEDMRETGVRPTEETYVALLEACRSTRDSKAAVEVFEAMQSEGVRPGVRSYTSLLEAISDDNTRRTRDLQRSRQLEGRLVVSPSQPSPAAVAPSAIEYPAQGLVSISPESTIGGPLTVELSLPQPAFEGAKLETAVEGDVMAAAHRTAKLAASGAGEGPGRVMGPSLDGVQTAVELLVQSHEAPLEADDGSEVMPRPEEVSSERRQPRQRGEITGHAATKLATPLTAVGEEEATLVDTATTAPPFATAASPSSSTAIPSAGKELPKDVGLPRPAPLADSGDNDVVGEAGFARSTPASTSSPPAYASDSRSPPGTWGSSTSLPGSAVGGPSSIDQELHDAPNSSKTKAVEEEEEQEEDEEQDEDEGEENGSITNSSGLENPALDNLFRVFLVFQEMRSRGVRPDLRAYNALVNTCAEVGDLDRALEVVRQMVDEDHGGGLQPDAVTYTSLIKAAARATPPRVEEAEEIFAAMQQRTNHFSTFARPTEVTYAHLMRASVEAGKYGRAIELWWQQLAAGLAPGSRSARAALTACRGAGDIDTALEVYRVMRDAGLRPDNRSTLDLVKLCRANDMPEVATSIMRERSNYTGRDKITGHRDNRRYPHNNHGNRSNTRNDSGNNNHKHYATISGISSSSSNGIGTKSGSS